MSCSLTKGRKTWPCKQEFSYAWNCSSDKKVGEATGCAGLKHISTLTLSSIRSHMYRQPSAHDLHLATCNWLQPLHDIIILSYNVCVSSSWLYWRGSLNTVWTKNLFEGRPNGVSPSLGVTKSADGRGVKPCNLAPDRGGVRSAGSPYAEGWVLACGRAVSGKDLSPHSPSCLSSSSLAWQRERISYNKNLIYIDTGTNSSNPLKVFQIHFASVEIEPTALSPYLCTSTVRPCISTWMVNCCYSLLTPEALDCEYRKTGIPYKKNFTQWLHVSLLKYPEVLVLGPLAEWPLQSFQFCGSLLVPQHVCSR